MKQPELDLILEKHQLFLNNKEGGKCADLRNTNLSGLNLNDINLRGVVLNVDDLSEAELCHAVRSGAVLYEADLPGATGVTP